MTNDIYDRLAPHLPAGWTPERARSAFPGNLGVELVKVGLSVGLGEKAASDAYMASRLDSLAGRISKESEARELVEAFNNFKRTEFLHWTFSTDAEVRSEIADAVSEYENPHEGGLPGNWVYRGDIGYPDFSFDEMSLKVVTKCLFACRNGEVDSAALASALSDLGSAALQSMIELEVTGTAGGLGHGLAVAFNVYERKKIGSHIAFEPLLAEIGGLEYEREFLLLNSIVDRDDMAWVKRVRGALNWYISNAQSQQAASKEFAKGIAKSWRKTHREMPLADESSLSDLLSRYLMLPGPKPALGWVEGLASVFDEKDEVSIGETVLRRPCSVQHKGEDYSGGLTNRMFQILWCLAKSDNPEGWVDQKVLALREGLEGVFTKKGTPVRAFDLIESEQGGDARTNRLRLKR